MCFQFIGGVNVENKILDLLNKSNSLPYLFVGTGFSKRYINMCDWEQLLELVSKKIEKDSPFALKKYKSLAEVNLKQKNGGTYDKFSLLPEVASLLEDALNSVWFTNAEFEASREIYKNNHPLFDVSLLKFEASLIVQTIFNENVTDLNLPEEIDLLKSLKSSIHGIITTNYDPLLETLFGDSFVTHIGQSNMLIDSGMSVGDIFKIHGSSTNPNSMVLTSNDYQEFKNKSIYLTAKLLTIFIEHPIVFIGYSMQDENIINILENIGSILTPDLAKALSNRLIFIKRNRDSSVADEIKTVRMSFSRDIEIEMTEITLQSFIPLYSAISKKKSLYPINILRMLRKDVYDLVISNDSNSKIQVLDFDTKLLENREIVVGVGITQLGRKGYRLVKVKELIEDVLFEKDELSAKLIIEETLPDFARSNHGSFPIYKYISLYEAPLSPLLNKFLVSDYDDFLSRTDRRLRDSMISGLRPMRSIKCIMDSPLSLNSKLLEIISLGGACPFDLDVLGDLLRSLYSDTTFDIHTSAAGSNFRKLVRIYDWLRYKK